MMNYLNAELELLEKEKLLLSEQYEQIKRKNLNLDISRGKPSEDQLDISVPMLDIINSGSSYKTESGVDCRNYGLMDGLPSCKKLFAEMMQVEPDMVMVGGNSSLNLMFDVVSALMTKSIEEECSPWLEVKDRKFLCPVPGYDRHFGVTEYYGFEMINVPMLETGPDMDIVEQKVSEDASIKGIWCVPKYSNPQGVTYSDETVRRFANLKPKAKDFRILWDDAYCVHDLEDETVRLLSLWEECKKAGNEDIAVFFSSTSKITFAGAGVASMASSLKNMKFFKNRYKYQTIGYDKINMQRHILFLKDYNGVLEHMKKNREILKPRFDLVFSKLNDLEKDIGVIRFQKPHGGYFVSVDVLEGTAKKVVSLCKSAGLVLTPAGATYPYFNDPKDSNIRLAPTYPSIEELDAAMDVFCICVKLAALERLTTNG